MTAHDDWAAVGDSLHGLALKLKLHFEEAAGTSASDAKSAIESATDGIEAALDGLRAVVDDPAVQQDLNDVATGLRDAMSNTFAELRSQLASAARDR